MLLFLKYVLSLSLMISIAKIIGYGDGDGNYVDNPSQPTQAPPTTPPPHSTRSMCDDVVTINAPSFSRPPQSQPQQSRVPHSPQIPTIQPNFPRGPLTTTFLECLENSSWTGRTQAIVARSCAALFITFDSAIPQTAATCACYTRYRPYAQIHKNERRDTTNEFKDSKIDSHNSNDMNNKQDINAVRTSPTFVKPTATARVT